MARIKVSLEFEIDREELPDADELREGLAAALPAILRKGEFFERAHWAANFLDPGDRSLTGCGGGTRRGMKMEKL